MVELYLIYAESKQIHSYDKLPKNYTTILGRERIKSPGCIAK